MNKGYEKPKMKFVSLQNNEKIANTCWGNHSESTQRYYDIVGKGYVGFYISGGSCALYDEKTKEYYLVVNYYDHKGDTEADRLATDDPRFQDMYKRLLAAVGGNEAQPFKGEDQFPVDPSPMS